MEGYHNQLKQQTARISVVSNTLLVVLKLLVGVFTGAVSIISEAAHSAVDLIAALVAYLAVKKSSQPPDSQHAYGHGKIENLSAAFEAVLIVIAALWIVYESVQKIKSPHVPEFLEYGLLVMALSMIVNYWVSGKLYAVAQLTGSHALEADALHLRADIWTSAGVLIGLTIIKLTGLYWLDPVIAIAVAMIVFKAGFSMTMKSVYELTDICLPVQEEEAIRAIVIHHPAVIAFHQLRTRRSGSFRLIDMHLVLQKNMHLDKAHAVCDEIELLIKQQFAPCDVTIHLEPCDYHEGFGACPAECKEKCKNE
ncbi:cation diffusion facilitator family transporter [Sporomusa acidovorans]|uniref:Ferrous-iron efflux pump FieF n=1 Tax=Sporomusa acidovorans (strain ATCC 49682 / DSM 3132 / Mol) TaxID=1123286 RepID=A0ABZ3JBV8_SPOA4|nr:cation diffusion facilitator family transporter [Sporomusa acidovorans]OZC22687.1 ferrous-iron efflux pump FieF [Sporomusa acidovorans DSM 3132]SDE78154.1 cation diffusion facilitator family transporter [Sporomusa acidovorans]